MTLIKDNNNNKKRQKHLASMLWLLGGYRFRFSLTCGDSFLFFVHALTPQVKHLILSLTLKCNRPSVVEKLNRDHFLCSCHVAAFPVQRWWAHQQRSSHVWPRCTSKIKPNAFLNLILAWHDLPWMTSECTDAWTPSRPRDTTDEWWQWRGSMLWGDAVLQQWRLSANCSWSGRRCEGYQGLTCEGTAVSTNKIVSICDVAMVTLIGGGYI